MKTTKTVKGNKERINDLKSVFQKTTASEKEKAKKQIELAKQDEQDPQIETEESPQHLRPIVSIQVPERIVRKEPLPAMANEAVTEVEFNPKRRPNVIPTEKQPQLRFNAVFSAMEQNKMMELRMFLTQRGINTSISDSQLARLAMRKLVITEDLVELFKQVQLEDGRRYRQPSGRN
jgi:hypothetical protein